MARFFIAGLFLAAAGGVYWYNATHPGAVIGFLWLPAVISSVPDDPKYVGDLSWKILLGMGGISLVLALRGWLRDRAFRRQMLEEE